MYFPITTIHMLIRKILLSRPPPLYWGNAVSLARTHQKMRTKSREIGVQCEPTAAGRRFALDPNFEGRGPHYPVSPSQTHRIHIVIGKLKPATRLNPPISHNYRKNTKKYFSILQGTRTGQCVYPGA